MLSRSRLPQWLNHVAVVLGFVVISLLLRKVAWPYWIPHVGFGFACVLLLPRRFWPALLAGNFITAAPSAIACFPQYGWGGMALHIVPYVAFAMVAVALLRDYLPGQRREKQAVQLVTSAQMLGLLACMVAFVTVLAMDSTLVYAQTITAGQDVRALILKWGPRFFLGEILGCLIVAPLVLAIYEAVREASTLREFVKRAARSRLLLEGVVLGVGALGLLTALGAGVAGDVWRQGARLAMFAPVAWMAVRYGWQGAAVGGTAASVGIMLTLSPQYDSDAVMAQMVIALATAILLPVGAVVGRLDRLERQANEDLRQSVHDARREIYQAELRLRDGMQAMDRVHDSLIDMLNRLLHRYRHFVPEEEERRYRKQLVALKHERHWLANSIQPVQWQNRGLPAALFDGPIAQALNDSNVTFYAKVTETVTELSADVQMTLYRLTCEMVAHLLQQEPRAMSVRLRVLVSRSEDDRLVVVVVDAEEPPRPLTGTSESVLVAQDYLRSKLGAMGLSLSDMRGRAAIFGGRIRVSPRRRNRLVLSLRDQV